jgi:hypothetical protein
MQLAGHVALIGSRGTHICYWWEIREKRDHQEEQKVGGRVILRRIWRVRVVGTDWIGFTQNRDKWRALVNAVLNLRVP